MNNGISIIKNNIKLIMMSEFMEIVDQIDALIPQFAGFIDQFNTLVIQKSINVITDSCGNMSIDVPNNMQSKESDNLSKRISIIDSLIESHNITITDLFERGFNIENKLKSDNGNQISELVNKKAEFNKLRDSYRHIR
jgi:hypothetical protein